MINHDVFLTVVVNIISLVISEWVLYLIRKMLRRKHDFRWHWKLFANIINTYLSTMLSKLELLRKQFKSFKIIVRGKIRYFSLITTMIRNVRWQITFSRSKMVDNYDNLICCIYIHMYIFAVYIYTYLPNRTYHTHDKNTRS